MLPQLRSLASALMRRRRFERDMQDELQFHVEAYAEDLVRTGVSREEAYRRAQREFGMRRTVEEDCRQARGLRVFDELRQDVRYAVRTLAKSPGFTTVAVLTLALGIGAPTAVFSLANWMLFRPVPGTTDPHEVRYVQVGQRTERGSLTVSRVSYPNYRDLVPRLRTISGLAGVQSGTVALATGRETARDIECEFVTASYFDVLGVRMRGGRAFTEQEDAAGGAAHVAVISERLWETSFGRSDQVFQRPVRLNGVPFTVIGVVGEGFRGTDRVSAVDVWLPGATSPVVNHQTTRYEDRASGGFYRFIARLAAGATWPQVEAELASLGPWLVEQYPEANAKFRQSALYLYAPIGFGTDTTATSRMRALLGVIMGACALVLLIVCSNVASLLLIKGVGRRDEVAVRKALGASRARLVRQHLTEGVLVWLIGGATGAFLVWLLATVLKGSGLVALRVPDLQVPIDWRVLTFVAGVSLLVGITFSLFPALRAVRAEAAETLRETTPSATLRMKAGAALSAVQLSAALTLLVGALLLAASVRHLTNIPLGFDPTHVTTFHVSPRRVGYSESATFDYVREFERRLALVPGVEAVAVARGLPLVDNSGTRVRRLGASPEELRNPRTNEIASASFFRALGIALRRGRLFEEADIGSPGEPGRQVVIVSESLAAQLFPHGDAVGQRIEMPVRGREKKTYEVIGVVADTRVTRLVGDIEPIIYEPSGLDGTFLFPSWKFVVHTKGPVDIGDEIRSIATDLDSALPLGPIRPLQDVVNRQHAEWTLLGNMMSGFAIVATVLAAMGLYGVVAFSVAQRRREFGVRIALGATPPAIVRLVLRSVRGVAGAGLLLGLGGAVALVRTIDSRLIGVDRFDLTLWVAAALGMIGVVVISSIIPVRHALRSDVTQALKTL
jgi:putative ABC transport system permease protein